MMKQKLSLVKYETAFNPHNYRTELYESSFTH